MKTGDEIFDFASKHFPILLKAYLKNENFFPPIHKSFGRYKVGDLQKNFGKIQEEIDSLIKGSKQERGYGYEIIWEEKKTQALGKNQFPKSIQFNNEKDYIRFINKENEFECFKEDSRKIIEYFPVLKIYLQENPIPLIKFSKSIDQIIEVCKFFQKNPKPNIYMREIPAEGLDTKFIENHAYILSQFLDQILNPDDIQKEEDSFEKKFHLKIPPALVRFRILDKEINNTFPFNINDITIPIQEFETFNLQEERIYVVENQINFLSFPSLKNSLVILGAGYGVINISKSKNLRDKEIYYWGDLDSRGFDILSKFREELPKTKSIFMDSFTYESYSHLSTNENKPISWIPVNLTTEELELFNYLNSSEKWNRLEQEKIPMDYITQVLQN